VSWTKLDPCAQFHLDLLPAVPISVFIGYVVPMFVESSIPEQNPYPLAMFIFSCISIVPLSYFISLSVERYCLCQHGHV
jgi:hypothetical protein